MALERFDLSNYALKDRNYTLINTFCLFNYFYSVPDGILQAKFSKSCQVLVTILASHASDGTPGLLRPVSFHKMSIW